MTAISITQVSSALMEKYPSNPTGAKKVERYVLAALNGSAVAATILSAVFASSNKATWMEVLFDSSVHVLSIATLFSETPIWPAVTVNAYRLASLVKFSTFPEPVSVLDGLLHTVNIISPLHTAWQASKAKEGLKKE